MDKVEVIRRAVSDLAAKKLGRDARQPRTLQMQLTAAEALSFIMVLPVDIDSYEPLQDPDTGELYYVMGADFLGDAPLGG